MAKAFNITIDAKTLAKGLRQSKRMPRNSGFLTVCDGATGKDGTLSALEELTRIDTSVITDVFPYPQIFVLTNMIIICSSTKIYELVGDDLVEKLEVEAGSSWVAVDFYNYVYMSNGKVAVIRSSDTGIYSETSDLPTASSMDDFNGQVIIGSPDEIIPGIGLLINAGVFETTLVQLGDWV